MMPHARLLLPVILGGLLLGCGDTSEGPAKTKPGKAEPPGPAETPAKPTTEPPAEPRAPRTGILERAQQTKSKDNLRNVGLMLISRSIDKGWPPYTGKNFVLSLVTAREIDPSLPGALSVLFSPNDKRPRPGPDAYAAVTRTALKAERFPELTSYAGPSALLAANAATTVTPNGAPLAADFTFDDVVLVAFANGSVLTLDRAALGLGPDDPLVPGPASKSPILKALSLD